MRIAAVWGAHRRGGAARGQGAGRRAGAVGGRPSGVVGSKPVGSCAAHRPPRPSRVRWWSVAVEAAVV
jgi:hypothetical protein